MSWDELAPGRAHLQSAQSSTPDAAIEAIVQLLGLVAEEESVLARLDRCVDELRRIATARAALADCTQTELLEAHAQVNRTGAAGSAPMLPIIDGGAS